MGQNPAISHRGMQANALVELNRANEVAWLGCCDVGSVHGERTNIRGLVLGCIEADFCKCLAVFTVWGGTMPKIAVAGGHWRTIGTGHETLEGIDVDPIVTSWQLAMRYDYHDYQR